MLAFAQRTRGQPLLKERDALLSRRTALILAFNAGGEVLFLSGTGLYFAAMAAGDRYLTI
jgi:hypothetical protein